MSLLIGDNFNYQGQKSNFERDSFETLAAMKAYPETSLDDGHLSYCKEDGKRYEYKSSNSVDPTTGKWREFKTGTDSSADIQDLKEKYSELEGLVNDSVWQIQDATFEIGGAQITTGTNGFVGRNLTVRIKYLTQDETEQSFTLSGVIPGGSATDALEGLVKIGSATRQTVTANSPTSEAGRTYPIQKDQNGKLVVNVPGGTYDVATTTANGLMSKEDKALLDSIPGGLVSSIDPFSATADSVNFNYYSFNKANGEDQEYNEELPIASHTQAGIITATDKIKLDSTLAGTIITAAEYEELGTKDNQTIYFIKG